VVTPIVAGATDEQGGEEPIEPEVAGTTDETIEEAPVPTDATLLTLGDLKLSPDARFSYRQIDWRTYEFDAKSQGQVAGAFGWDFGDGSTSVNGQVVHTFPRAGSYKVTLAVATDDGKMYTDSQVITISFFHLGNPLVDAVIGVLIFLILALMVYLYRLRRENV
jgi:PKD repeat protein